MATAIISIILTFVLTGLVGNFLVYRWQHRNWISQQKFSGEEKHYFALITLWEELMNLASRRLWRMRKLLTVVSVGDNNKIEDRLNEYSEVLSEWNEKFHSMSVRLTLYASWNLTRQLETELQQSFLNTGLQLERLAKTRLTTGAVDRNLVARLNRQFEDLSRQVFVFNRTTLKAVQDQRSRTYHGVEVDFTRRNLEKFGTWELLKALFKPGIQPLRVVRSASDLYNPLRTRD
jgi:hypothetical protein